MAMRAGSRLTKSTQRWPLNRPDGCSYVERWPDWQRRPWQGVWPLLRFACAPSWPRLATGGRRSRLPVIGWPWVCHHPTLRSWLRRWFCPRWMVGPGCGSGGFGQRLWAAPPACSRRGGNGVYTSAAHHLGPFGRAGAPVNCRKRAAGATQVAAGGHGLAGSLTGDAARAGFVRRA